ncbi:hypothetical protein [Streptomyces anulatus]|uniref:DUF3558 domain-containing protein n=1 Tax=Streptomyces anulatus TaxID=1892 RepID=A0A7K3RGX6_STRAQ|nr:hypothetical protein [Streptomyces anulatus]NEC01272.1 hypothetical protein [Streptomyces anulatus]NED29047.1 hypothetical protein [Streptomyces anulatus]
MRAGGRACSVGVVVAGLLAFAAVGCSGDGKAGATGERATEAIDLCGGEAVSAEVAESLAMAKELGCENNGGLKDRPSLDPA